LLLLLPCLLFFDLGIAIRVGGGDAGVFQRLLDLGLSKCVEVALVILNGAEDKGAELETHSLEIHMGFLADLLLETALVPVQLLDRQGTDDATQVAGHRLLDGRLDIVHRHTQKPLCGAPDMVDVALHLDLGYRLDVDRDALDGVNVGHVDLESHHAQRENLVLLPRRPHEGAAAADDAETLDFALLGADLFAEKLAATEDDQRFVRTRLLVAHADQKVAEEENGRNDDQ
jgi:hypothetical protein